MPKTQTKPGLSPRELDALRRQYLAEWASWKKQRDSASRWELANDIASGINDIVGRGVIAPVLGAPADIGDLLWNAGAWVNNKIKDVEYATGMVKPDLSSLVTGQRKGYIPYSQGNPYLGSEDIANRMERAGLVSPKRRPMAELTASLVSPGAAAKTAINAPKTAMNMLRMAENLEAPSRGVRTADGMYIPRGQMGAIENLYHGSPHTFDRFDLNKIGTGEGAQAYGYGAYLAESPDVAKQYAKQSANVTPPPNRAFRGQELTPGTPEYHAATLLEYGGLQKTKKDLAKWIAEGSPDENLVNSWKSSLDFLNKAEKKSDFKVLPNENLYQTRLAWPDAREATDPLSPEHFLDWDKPLSEQGGVQTFSALPDFARPLDATEAQNVTGQGLYQRLANRLGEEGAANILRNSGIPGIRYLDEGSRGAGKGTSNYVVFDDKLIDIVSRNNQPIKK